MSSLRSLQILFSLALLISLKQHADAAELPAGVKTLSVNSYDMAYLDGATVTRWCSSMVQ